MTGGTYDELPISRVADRYRLRRPIARGAMGEVYSGWDEETERPVAAKRLLDRRHAIRFEIEARLLQRLRHPRVVEVLDYLVDDTGNWLVMNLVDGEDLEVRLRGRGQPGLPLKEAIGYVTEACEALQYIHEQDTVHRDVKPRNLVLGGDGVVLVDFGIARDLEGEGIGTVGIGTPGFMPPELYTSGKLTPATDVFGLAATLWMLLSGEPPALGPPGRLEGRVPGVTASIDGALRAGLALDPEKRSQSAREFAEMLGQSVDTDQGRSLAVSVSEPSASRGLLEALTRAAAGLFNAAASSVALLDAGTGDLVYEAAWGAGADIIVGTRLSRGRGIAGAVVTSGEGVVVARCREDERFDAQTAARTGYVPHTMLVVPLRRDGETLGVLALLDRRDGTPYGAEDLRRANFMGELAIAAVAADPHLASAFEPTVAPEVSQNDP
jgi:hypothetical protein